MLSLKLLKRGTGIPLFFFLLGSLPVAAQQTDTTGQGPVQLQTLPSVPQAPARPKPARVPAVTPVATPAPPDTLAPRKPALAQTEEKEGFDLLKKLFLAGSTTFNLMPRQGPGIAFVVGATPMLGYKINKVLAMGPGLDYAYVQTGDQRAHGYGPKAFAQVSIYKKFLLHGENLWLKSVFYQKDQQGNSLRLGQTLVSNTVAGVGYRSMLNDRFGMDLYGLWTVRATNPADTDNIRSPRIRVGLIYHLK